MKADARTPEKPRARTFSLSRLRLFVGVVVILGCLAAVVTLVVNGGAASVFITALDNVQEIGPWGAPLLIGCEALAFTLLVPISPLHVGMGFLYGPAYGTLLAWTAYTLGCVPPFLLARLPMFAERFAQVRRRIDVLDGVFGAVELEPCKLIATLRLSPLLPSPLNSYLLGLTNVSLLSYVLGSMAGSLPNICAHVYVGTMLDSLAEIASGRVNQSRFTWIMLFTGCVATLSVVAYVSRVATRRIQAARSKMGSSELETEIEPFMSPTERESI